MAVRPYCMVVITLPTLLKYGDLDLILLVFWFTKFKIRYCPIAYIIAIAINAPKPQLVDTLVISEILLNDISIINEAIVIEMTVRNFMLVIFWNKAIQGNYRIVCIYSVLL